MYKCKECGWNIRREIYLHKDETFELIHWKEYNKLVYRYECEKCKRKPELVWRHIEYEIYNESFII